MTDVFTKRLKMITLIGFMGIAMLISVHSGGAASPASNNSQETNMLKNLPEGHRVIEGKIKFIRGRLAEVEIIQDKENQGLTMPRFVSLDRPGETGATPHPGDPIQLVVNSQNLVVDYFVPEKNDVGLKYREVTIPSSGGDEGNSLLNFWTGKNLSRM